MFNSDTISRTYDHIRTYVSNHVNASNDKKIINDRLRLMSDTQVSFMRMNSAVFHIIGMKYFDRTDRMEVMTDSITGYRPAFIRIKRWLNLGWSISCEIDIDGQTVFASSEDLIKMFDKVNIDRDHRIHIN